jgi:PAP2 superfamily protein
VSATTAQARVPGRFARWRVTIAGPVVAVAILVWAIVATGSVGLVVRDPDHVAAQYLVLVGTGVALLVLVDIALRASRRTGAFPPSRAAMTEVRRERWTPWRTAAAGSALFAFYVSYMAYRNLKAIVPLVRPGELFDTQLADFDRAIFAGNDPATLLHTLLGTGLMTHVFSTFYVAFIVFLPLTIGLSLVFSRDLEAGLFYTTAQSINWVLGAASYFLLPSLGPAYADPALFSALPVSEVTHLQGVLMDQRVAFLANPASATPQAIAAFASLHISMSFTAAVAAHLLGLGQRLKVALWTWFGVTMLGTIYLGWHYVADNVAGIVMGTMALVLAGVLTGIDLPAARMRRRGDLVSVRDEAAATS